jgi:hypothetical protein
MDRCDRRSSAGGEELCPIEGRCAVRYGLRSIGKTPSAHVCIKEYIGGSYTCALSGAAVCAWDRIAAADKATPRITLIEVT